MRNRRLKSIALFSGSFFLLLLLLLSNRIYAVTGSPYFSAQPAARTGVSTGATYRPVRDADRFSSANLQLTQHSRMNGKAGHHDKCHSETDLFAGANKAGAPAASRALVSD